MPLNKNAGILHNKMANKEDDPVPELVCIKSFSEDANNMYLIEETPTEVNFSLKKHPFSGESITIKREPDDFDNRETENEVDQNLDEKPTIQIHSRIKSEEEDLINSQCLTSHEEVNIKREGDVEQSDTQFTNHKDRHKSKDQIEIYKCPDCPYQSKYQFSIKQHSVKHKKPDEMVWHQCTECTYKTKRKADLLVHSLVHSNNKSFKCAQCPYQAKRKKFLKWHQLKQCPFRATMKCNLEGHVEWYKCEQCSFKTTRKYGLRKHAFKHNMDDAQWLQCTSCSFKTLQKSQFKRHQMKHQDDDRPDHKCPECPYKAIRKYHLKVHIKHHNAADKADWLQCPECSFRTFRTESLKAHQMLHTSVGE